MIRRHAYLLPACALALVCFLYSAPFAHRTPADVLLHCLGAAAIAIGVVIARRAPAIGRLVVLTGAAFYLGDLRVSPDQTVFAIGFCLAYLWTAMITHVVLSLPSGRLDGTPVRLLQAISYAAAIGTQVGRYLADDPRPPWWWNHDPGRQTAWALAGSLIYIAVSVAVLVVLIWRWARSTTLRRRQIAAIWACSIVAGVAAISAALASVLGAGIEVRTRILLAAAALIVLVIPIGLGLRKLHMAFAQGRAARAVLDAGGESVPPERLRKAIADAVGDPSLSLHYPKDDGTWVDSRGRATTEPTARPGRAVTRVERGDRLVAVVEHDEALTEQRLVAAAALDVASLAIDNASLHTRLRQVPDAAFVERHRIQRDLHDGAQQPLYAAMLLLDLARTGTAPVGQTLERAARLLREAITAMRDLTSGIYPETLRADGLAAAFDQIAELSPIPVTVDVPRDRWPPRIELALYFLVREAIANAYRHAGASHVGIVVRTRNQRLVLDVVDDGLGGAGDPAALRARAASVGGELTVVSGPGDGTRIRVELPVEG
ncbi:sensor histidine kinase [Actinokineospora sp. HUAS TT18]|uniref:sensor histidine kinase n=1 Tax=Actinokineospora sp. HUAS TT18 TaxID=3447451 RepID=UPI003F51B2D2